MSSKSDSSTPLQWGQQDTRPFLTAASGLSFRQDLNRAEVGDTRKASLPKRASKGEQRAKKMKGCFHHKGISVRLDVGGGGQDGAGEKNSKR